MKNILKNTRGAVIVLTALLLPVFIGFAGLAVDVGMAYTQKNKAQHALDTATLAAGWKLKDLNNNNSPSNSKEIIDVFSSYLEKNGFPDAEISTPSFYKDNTNRLCIDTKISINVPTYFAKLFGIDNWTIPLTATSYGNTTGSSGTFPSYFSDYVVFNGTNQLFHLAGTDGSGTNKYTGNIFANGKIQMSGNDDMGVDNGSYIHGNITSAGNISKKVQDFFYNPKTYDGNTYTLTENAESIDITQNNPIMKNFIDSLKSSVDKKIDSGDITGAFDYESYSTGIYVEKGSFTPGYTFWGNNGASTPIGIIIANGDVEIPSFPLKKDHKVFICSLTGNVTLYPYKDSADYMEAYIYAPAGRVRFGNGGIYFKGSIIAHDIKFGNGDLNLVHEKVFSSSSGNTIASTKPQLIK